MKKAVLALLFAVLFLGQGTVGYAAHSEIKEIRHKIHETQERIDRGAKSGLLTRREVHWLQGKLDEIRDKFGGMIDDGLSDREYKRLEHDLDRLNSAITREKNEKRRY